MAHVKSYSDLMVEGIQQAITTWKLRLIMYSLSLAFLFFGMLSATVSALLWAALPVLNEQNNWVLLTLPLVLFLMSFLFYFLGRSYKTVPLFNDIQEQLILDKLAICQASAK